MFANSSTWDVMMSSRDATLFFSCWFSTTNIAAVSVAISCLVALPLDCSRSWPSRRCNTSFVALRTAHSSAADFLPSSKPLACPERYARSLLLWLEFDSFWTNSKQSIVLAFLAGGEEEEILVNLVEMVWWSARLEVGNWNWTFSAGSSRNKYVCSRTLTAHPGQTSGHKMIADTNTTPFDNEITVFRCHVEKSDSRARKFSHCGAWTLGLFFVPKKFNNHLQYVLFKYAV